jgi:hypothetical protein
VIWPSTPCRREPRPSPSSPRRKANEESAYNRIL